eukprot:3160791-Heterocapsa_arctica.AAC.1
MSLERRLNTDAFSQLPPELFAALISRMRIVIVSIAREWRPLFRSTIRRERIWTSRMSLTSSGPLM